MISIHIEVVYKLYPTIYRHPAHPHTIAQLDTHTQTQDDDFNDESISVDDILEAFGRWPSHISGRAAAGG